MHIGLIGAVPGQWRPGGCTRSVLTVITVLTDGVSASMTPTSGVSW